jgi:hypothetical protein
MSSALCVFYENNSFQDVAMVWSHDGGEAFERIPACWRMGGAVARPAPWTAELGIAPDEGTALVGKPIAQFSSADVLTDVLPERPPIIGVVISASGKVTIQQLSSLPLGVLGKTC